MEFLKEFKKFAMQGNVIDLAIGVIIGGAFGSIITSLVQDIITPLIMNPILKSANLDDLSKLTIEGTAIKYGNFLSTCLTFLIIAFCLFLVIRGINYLKNKQKEEVVELTKEQQLLTEIRDLLENK